MKFDGIPAEYFLGSLALAMLLVIVLFTLAVVLKRKRKPRELKRSTEQEIDLTGSRTEASPDAAVEHAPAQAVEERRSLADALVQTRLGFIGRIKALFVDDDRLTDDEVEGLEEILYTSDLGPRTVQRLLDAVKKNGHFGFEMVREALRLEMQSIFDSLNPNEPPNGVLSPLKPNETGELTVWMIVGVNGAGKTTSIGKIASQLAGKGMKVLVAAGDTFRAAADAQLRTWTDRAQVEIFSPDAVKDPSAVAFDAVTMAKARGFNHVIIDTAGRLHTQKNLMEELKKMKRVIQKVMPSAPHEILLVLDANSGQNALIQAREFNDAIGVTGVILTKMDGTAKGGVALGVAGELQIPVKLIGVGEGLDDLRAFSPKEYVASII